MCGISWPQPCWGWAHFPPGFPRVARCSQPWAGGLNPSGLTVGGNPIFIKRAVGDTNFPEEPEFRLPSGAAVRCSDP